jgi:hypothetical protein
MLMDKTNILIIMLKTLKMMVYIENINMCNLILWNYSYTKNILLYVKIKYLFCSIKNVRIMMHY